MKTKILGWAAILLLAGPVGAHAALLTADPGGGATTIFTTTGNNGFGDAGPVNINGFSVTGSPQVTYGNATYGLNNNGSWNQSWVATNNTSGSVTFDLGADYSFAGFFLNYALLSGGLPNGSNPTITAIASDGFTILSSFDIFSLAPIVTPFQINAGAFRGISESSAVIRYVRLSGSYIIAHSITVGGPASVPEPGTLALLGLGLCGLSLSRRRKAS